MPPVTQTTGGNCSPAVVSGGKVEITCLGLDPRQKQLLEKIPELLNQVLRQQIDRQRLASTLDALMTQSQRVLKPLGNFAIRGSFRLPDTIAPVVDFKKELSTSIQKGEESKYVHSLFEGTGPPGFGRFDQLTSPARLVAYVPDKAAPFYPKSGPLSSLLESLLVNVHVYVTRDRGNPLGNRRPNLSVKFDAIKQPSMFPHLQMKPDGAIVIAFMAQVPYGQWSSDGVIASVEDVLGARLVVQPLFSDSIEDRDSLAIWSQLALNSLEMTFGDGQWFRFVDEVTDRANMPVFKGVLSRSLSVP